MAENPEWRDLGDPVEPDPPTLKELGEHLAEQWRGFLNDNWQEPAPNEVPTMAEINSLLIQTRSRWDDRAETHSYWTAEELEARHNLDRLILQLGDLGG